MAQRSMRKFYEERGGPQHGGPLAWPGTAEGFPVRGESADIRGDEINEIPLAMDYKSRIFKLWEPEEHAAFNDIMDRIINGWFMQHKRIDRWCDQHCGLLIWLEWVQIYGEIVTSKSPGALNAPRHPQQPQ